MSLCRRRGCSSGCQPKGETMTVTIKLNGTTTLDESADLQNAIATPSPTGDADDNDVALSALPSAFSTRLFGAGQLALSSTFAAGGRVAKSPDNFLQISATGTVSNV